MTRWEYIIVALAEFGAAKSAQGGSEAVAALNRQGDDGWEAIGLTPLPDGSFAVLLKRPIKRGDMHEQQPS